MCEQAKIKGSKSTHSLRATAATQMFRGGAPEKVIQERTGHRSLEGLRSYERTCESQHRALSNLLSSNATERKKEPQQQLTNSKILTTTSTQLNKTSTESSSIIPSMNLKDCNVIKGGGRAKILIYFIAPKCCYYGVEHTRKISDFYAENWLQNKG